MGSSGSKVEEGKALGDSSVAVKVAVAGNNQ